MTLLEISKVSERACFPDLTIWLTRDATSDKIEEWRLERVDSKSQFSNHTIRFNSSPILKTALSNDLIEAVQGYLPNVEGKYAVSARDFLLELRGAILSDIYVIGMVTRAGLQRVSVKFKSFLGEAKSLFIGEASSLFSNDSICDLATRTIKDLLLPVLNIASVYDPSRTVIERLDIEKILPTLDNLVSKKQEIEFQLSLLQHFVRSCEAGVISQHDYEDYSKDGMGSSAIQSRSVVLARESAASTASQ